MGTLGDRLRAERLRLGLSQIAFAEQAGAKKHSQIRYERGERSPDGDYLQAAAEAGADVLYILTGRRRPPLAGTAEEATRCELPEQDPRLRDMETWLRTWWASADADDKTWCYVQMTKCFADFAEWKIKREDKT